MFDISDILPETEDTSIGHTNWGRPLGQCRQMASGNLQSDLFQPQKSPHFSSSAVDFDRTYTMQAAQNHSPHFQCHQPASVDAQQLYTTMTAWQTTSNLSFRALFDSMDVPPTPTPNTSFSPMTSPSNTSSSSSVDSSDLASSRPKRKRPYVPHLQRKPEVVVKRNARERRRMGNLQGAFRTLQKHLPYIKYSSKRIPKEKILRLATDYIKHLQVLLNHPELNLESQDSALPIPSLTFLPADTPVTSSDALTCQTTPRIRLETSPVQSEGSNLGVSPGSPEVMTSGQDGRPFDLSASDSDDLSDIEDLNLLDPSALLSVFSMVSLIAFYRHAYHQFYGKKKKKKSRFKYH